jgi:Tol biopolymer transport system component
VTLSVGDLLQNRYRIEGLLGRGGMGAVYRAYDLVLSVPVAIKENLNPAPEAIRQFKREAVLLASLRHTHLPRVTDHFVVGSRQYLVMDFVAGEDLKTRLETEGAFPEAQVVDWAKEVCDALTYLHTRKPSVIHRDIKPANIKLTPEGQAILVDFGIAKVADASGGTSTGARSLTPGFAPPEQYGTRATDARSDQYSLAATLYTLLTGQVPPDSLERTIGQTNFRSPRELNPRVSPAVDQAILRALSLNPEERFRSVADFEDALSGMSPPLPAPGATQPRPPIAPPAPPASGAGSARSRMGLWLLLAVAAVVVLVIVAIVVAPLLRHSSAAAPAATAGPPEGLSSPQALGAKGAATPSPTAGGVIALAATTSPTLNPAAARPPTDTPPPSAVPTPIGRGALIAFASNRGPDGLFQIYTLNVTTGEVKQLTSDPTNKGHPAWTSDGSKLVYEAQVAKGNRDLFVMNADGSNPVDITNNPGDDFYPAVNPRSDIIAFVSTRNAVGAEQIYTMSLDGTGVSDISNLQARMPSEWDPAWSPDGNSLLLVRSTAGPVRAYRWDLTSPDASIVTMFAGSYSEGQPAWSLQGNLIAYTKTLSNGESEICVAVADSLPLPYCNSPVTDLDRNSNPTFSPDGRWITYTSDRTGTQEIYLMTVTGAGQKALTNPPSQSRDPAWQPVPQGGASS